MFIARLTGEADGHVVSRQFAQEGDAIRWLQGAGLAEYDDQTALGEVLMDGKTVWMKSGLQTPDQRQREIGRKAGQFLAQINFQSWRRR